MTAEPWIVDCDSWFDPPARPGGAGAGWRSALRPAIHALRPTTHDPRPTSHEPRTISSPGKFTALAAFLLLAATVAHGWPTLSGGKRTPAGACYPDDKQPGLWWLAPAPPMLKQVGGQPALSFTQYRYTGSRATGDQGTFWGKGVLQFALRFPENAPRLTQARAFLGPHARVEAVVPTEVRAEVAFAGAEEGGAGGTLGEVSADAPANATGGAAVLWDERSFSLALSPASTKLLADAFARGAVALSVNVVASAPAFRMPPLKGENAGTPESAALMVDAVPVSMDLKRQPEAVRYLDLDATMSAGYTFLDVACNDFAQGASFGDLGVVLVALTGIAVNGDRVTKELRFDAAAPAVQAVRFDRAVRLDRAYEVTIHRVFASGRSEQEGPRQVEVWSGFLDVSKGPPSEGSQLDPRLLY